MTSLASIIRALLHKHLHQWNSNGFWQILMEKTLSAVGRLRLLETLLALAGHS